MLNSPLEPVIAAMQECNTVFMVVARAKNTEPEVSIDLLSFFYHKSLLLRTLFSYLRNSGSDTN